MRTARLLALLAALLSLAVAAGNARSAESAPVGLHGFLLRADEPQQTSFSRTPSFAWSPVPGALHYEFQLSTSDAFRDNSVIYADYNAPTPVEAPPITLQMTAKRQVQIYQGIVTAARDARSVAPL